MDAAQQKYPVKEFFKAINALKLSLDITGIDHLYVDFDKFRSASTFKKLLTQLGIDKGHINEDAINAKVLYTGHTGCGKSTELLKLHHRINNPDQFFSIYLDIEEFIQVTDFKSEDLLVILISALISELEQHKINYGVPGLQKITADWLSDTEVNKEVKSRIESEGGVSGEIGAGFLKLFSVKGYMKSVFSYGSQTSKVVRQKILEKQGDYINSFKLALKEIRDDIRRTGKGKEIVFIIDGLEKLRWNRYDTYKKTFFQNISLINDLNCGMICCVPIDTIYDAEISQVLTTYNHFTLPLIAINEDTISKFSEIITRRIDKGIFFDAGVLEYCVKQSGGSPRQLLRIVELALYDAGPEHLKITMPIAEKTCNMLGLDLKRRLTSEHIRKLRSGEYEDADKLILDLLYSLDLMEYNCNQNNRLPNPLLKPFL